MSIRVLESDPLRRADAGPCPALPVHAPHDHDAGTLRELLRVALPLIVSMGSLSLMTIVDRIMLTGLSVDALAAAMPGALFHWTALGFPLGVAIYTNTFVAQYHGADRRDRVAAALWQAVWLSLGFGALLIAVTPAISALILRLSHAPEIAVLEAAYFRILCYGSGPMLLATSLAAFFSGRGQNSVVMWVNVAVSLLNVALDYVLIFGKWGFPQIGIQGAALGTVLANVAACGGYAWMIRRTNRREHYPFAAVCQIDARLIRRMLRFGLPNGLQLLMDIAAYLMFVLIIDRVGKVELAATNLAFNLNSLAFVPMLGLGTAVLTLVGRRIGEGQPELAARTTWRACALSLTYMLAFAVLYLTVPELLLRPYATFTAATGAEATSFDSLRPVVKQLLMFVAAYSVFDAMAITFGNAIRGAGDTRFSMIFSFCSGWFLMVLPSLLALRYVANPLRACWWAATAHITVLGLGLMARFMGGRWRSMTVIESPEAALD